jgi:environmental stress-induced protein Ves
MESKIITSGNFHTSAWSGGTTTELFIFPPEADYLLRNFQFRLSTATVETDKSDFTSLPGFSRKLMVLNGSITLSHKDHHSVQLNKSDVDEFPGDWKTSSIGRCTDVNLITAGKTAGKLSAMAIEKDQSANCIINEKSDWFIIYVYSGKVSININKLPILKKGDLLILNKPAICNFQIKGIENSDLALSEITL